MKVTKKDILDIKPGASLTMKLPTYNACLTGKQIAYQTALTDPRPEIKRYKVSINSKEYKITIEAIRKNESDRCKDDSGRTL